MKNFNVHHVHKDLIVYIVPSIDNHISVSVSMFTDGLNIPKQILHEGLEV